jgi:hypothetical protein
LNITLQSVECPENRRPPTDDVRRLILPAAVRTVQEIRVPKCIILGQRSVGCANGPHTRHALKIKATERPLFVPVMPHSRIDQKVVAPVVTPVSGVHVEPDGVHAKGCLRVGTEQRALHPPGGFDAGGSRRREQQNEPSVPAIVVELLPQRGSTPQVDEFRPNNLGGGSARAGPVPLRGFTRQRRTAQRDERRASSQQRNAPACHDEPATKGRQCPPGFLGTALGARFGHGALIDVTHRFPSNVVDPGAD